MPAHLLQFVEQRENEQFLCEQLCEQIDACPAGKGTIKNKLKNYLIEQKVWDISELDIGLRERYEQYLKKYEKTYPIASCLRAFDRVKLHTMHEEQHTLAGRRKYTTEYADQRLFLKYYPDLEIAETFLASTDDQLLLWDFTRKCPREIKEQIFCILKELLVLDNRYERKEKLLALHYLYAYCIETRIYDLQRMTLKEENGFYEFIVNKLPDKKRVRTFGIINLSRKILFLQATEINWKANVWYLERFHFSEDRINPSKPVESLSFKEVTVTENQNILQKYIRYLLGITDFSISTIRTKFLELRNFLLNFETAGVPIYEVEADTIHSYLKLMQEKDIQEKTFNGRIFILQQLYNILLEKGYITEIPFRYEYYLQKVIPTHHDRCVEDKIYEEILSKLANFPEHLRLMFLHLWCVGLRCSEVCTLEGGNYEEKNGDYWLKVYQVKMKTYKRIPIPEALYKLVQVYIKKYKIPSDEYLFKNRKGGAFRYATFCSQMMRYCRENQIANGEYIFKSHDYRHNLATLYYDTGTSIQAVRDYLGHEYEEMTRQYIDYMPRKLEKASDEYFKDEAHSFAAELMKGDSDGG